jgi:NAD-dependent DNA ligase
VAIPGIEKKSAEAFIEGLPRFWKFVKDNDMERVFVASAPVAKSPAAMASSPKQPSPVSKAKNEAVMANVKDKAFVFTGFRDKDAEALIEEYGGRVASGVTKKVDYLVIKEAEGKKSSKVEKAEELGISVITRVELYAMLGM